MSAATYWPGSTTVALAAALLVLASPAIGFPQDGQSAGKRASAESERSGRTDRTSASDVDAPEVLRRAPAHIHRAPLAFDGDLRPIGNRLARRLLAQTCPGTPERVKLEGSGERTWACDQCPAFTTRAGGQGPFLLESRIRGDYMQSGAREVFVTYRGCEPKSASFGGAMIFRRHSGAWEPFYRHPGLYPQACLEFEVEGAVDRLACRLRFQHQGLTVDKVVDVASGRGPKQLMRAADNTAKCRSGKLNSSYLIGWERRDVDGDGRPDLVLEKVQRHEPVGDRYDRRICSLEQTDGAWELARTFTRVYQLTKDGFTQRSRSTSPLSDAARRSENYARVDSGEGAERRGASYSAAGR